jgi:hypothetical protein
MKSASLPLNLYAPNAQSTSAVLSSNNELASIPVKSTRSKAIPMKETTESSRITLLAQ